MGDSYYSGGGGQAYQGVNYAEAFDRRYINTNAVTLTNQLLRLSYFVAQPSPVLCTQIYSTSGGTAAAATPTLCRMGLYIIDSAGAGTLVASCANDTALWAATNTEYAKALSVNYTPIAGQRYAFALLCVTGVAAPTTHGCGTTALAGTNSRAPRISATLAAQSDLPGTFADASLAATNAAGYTALNP